MDISDVRRKFPQYDDISDDALLAAVHRKFYSDIPRPEFLARFKKADPEPESPTRTLAQDATRAAGLGVRDVVQGLAAIPNIVGDAANTAVNYGIRGINALGGNVPELGLPSQATPRLLTKAGLPEPETPAEHFTSAVNQAAVGFGPMVTGAQLAGKGAQSIPFVRTLLERPAAELAAAATGAGASEATKQMGGGTAAQLFAGAIAPMGVNSAIDVTRRAAAVPSELLRPLSERGAKQIAADVLGRTAQDKGTALRNLSRYNTIEGFGRAIGSPGAKPTAAAVAADYGLIGGQQLVARGDASPLFAARQASNNEAWIADLAKLNATAKQVAAFEAKREAITAPMRESIFKRAKGPVDYGRVDGLIVALQNSAAGGKQESARALNVLRKWVHDKSANGRNSPEDAYALHQDINDLIRGRINDEQGPVRLAAGMATSVKKELADVIEDQAPGFKKYLEKYSRLSRPIERLETVAERLGGEDLSRVTNSAVMATQDGASYALSQDKMRRAVTDLKNETRLAPRQSDILSRVLGGMDAETLASRGGKQPGSDTYQNIASANFTNRVLGDTLAQSGAVKMARKPLDFILRPVESRISDLVVAAYQDPRLMEELLRMARTNRGSPTLAGLLQSGGQASSAGLLGSLFAQ